MTIIFNKTFNPKIFRNDGREYPTCDRLKELPAQRSIEIEIPESLASNQLQALEGVSESSSNSTNALERRGQHAIVKKTYL